MRRDLVAAVSGVLAAASVTACGRQPTRVIARTDAIDVGVDSGVNDARENVVTQVDASAEADADDRPPLQLAAMEGPFAKQADACAAALARYTPSLVPPQVARCVARPPTPIEPATFAHPFLEAATIEVTVTNDIGRVLALVRFSDGWYASTDGPGIGTAATGMMHYERHRPRLTKVHVEGAIQPLLRFDFDSARDSASMNTSTMVLDPFMPKFLLQQVVACGRKTKAASFSLDGDRIDLSAPPPRPRKIIQPLVIGSGGELDLVSLPPDADPEHDPYWQDQHVRVVWP